MLLSLRWKAATRKRIGANDTLREAALPPPVISSDALERFRAKGVCARRLKSLEVRGSAGLGSTPLLV